MTLPPEEQYFLTHTFGAAATVAAQEFRTLYQELAADLNSLALQFRNQLPAADRPSLLREYLAAELPELLSQDDVPREMLRTTLLLRQRGVPTSQLRILLRHPAPLPMTRYAQLTAATPEQVRVYLEYLRDYADQMGEDAGAVLILTPSPARSLELVDGEDVAAFVHTLGTDLDLAPARLSELFDLFVSHRRQYDPHHRNRYFAIPFSEIVRNVPAILWHTGGLRTHYTCLFHPKGANFQFLAAGGSLRKLPLGGRFTRGMARALLNLRTDQIDERIRDYYVYLYARSVGGNHELALYATHYIRTSGNDHAATWATLQRWDPILQKIAEAAPGTLAERDYPPLLGYCFHALRDQPDFTVRGRSLDRLRQRAAAYYEQIAQTRQRIAEERRYRKLRRSNYTNKWAPLTNVAPWEHATDRHRNGVHSYRVVELTTTTEVRQEGNTMRHCVYTYVGNCREGRCHLFSLREQHAGGRYRRLITVAVEPRSRTVTQALGIYNRHPTRQEEQLLQQWANDNALRYCGSS